MRPAIISLASRSVTTLSISVYLVAGHIVFFASPKVYFCDCVVRLHVYVRFAAGFSFFWARIRSEKEQCPPKAATLLYTSLASPARLMQR